MGPVSPQSYAISGGMMPTSAVRLMKMWFLMRRSTYSTHFSSNTSQK
jgi:hypothetical protein